MQYYNLNDKEYVAHVIKTALDSITNVMALQSSQLVIEELSSKYPRYASFSINSQRTRLSKAKKIFELNKQKEALQIILLSKRISEEDKKTALQYYNQL